MQGAPWRSAPTAGRCSSPAGSTCRSTSEVREALYDQIAAHDDVVVDLSAVESIDVPALKMLAVRQRAARARRPAADRAGCSPALRRIILFTRLRRLLPSSAAAISA